MKQSTFCMQFDLIASKQNRSVLNHRSNKRKQKKRMIKQKNKQYLPNIRIVFIVSHCVTVKLAETATLITTAENAANYNLYREKKL